MKWFDHFFKQKILAFIKAIPSGQLWLCCQQPQDGCSCRIKLFFFFLVECSLLHQVGPRQNLLLAKDRDQHL